MTEENPKITFEEVASLALALVLFISNDNEEVQSLIAGIAEHIQKEMFPDATE
jgi:hypothetical protein